MHRRTDRRVRALQREGQRGLLLDSYKGLEKEGLRVTPSGRIAQTPHPAALGSALCHPWITTDYSEALLEFVTPPCRDTGELVDFLTDVHRFTYHHIGDERLWATSMPCVLDGDGEIPIATYGDSNVGWMKHIYRRGLDWRYGRAMQAISGIHFNYSFSDEFLATLQAAEGDKRDATTYRSEAYFRLIRNFQRYAWLVPYLFGASPAICRSFTHGQNLHFHEHGEHTFYEPYGTSLRMSDIGYKNKAQAGLKVSYNSLDAYIRSLRDAINTPDAEYARLGTRVNGEWRQLNTNVLQIENEYYSFVRPKARAHSGEKPTAALARAGVEYVEIRALDLDPFEPLGVGVSQLQLMETLLLFCLLQDSPPIDPHEQGRIDSNQGLVARWGRDPSLVLHRGDGRRVALRQWADEIFDAMQGAAELLDEGRDEPSYSNVVAHYRQCVQDAEQTPSARVLASMRDHNEEFIEFAQRLSRQHEQVFKQTEPPPDLNQRFLDAAAESRAAQQRIEAGDELTFDAYLAHYFGSG